MRKTRSKFLYALAILLGALFVIACLMGFAACGDDDGNGGGGEPTTYTFEAEDAKLWADESEMWYWLENDVEQGNMITGMGFLYGVQEVDSASEGMSVGFLAHNNPTATFVIKSSKAVTGAKLTLRAASCDIDKDSIVAIGNSYVFGLSLSKINPYAGADHDILTVNGSKATLSGTLEGNDSVFKTGGSIADMDLAMDNWGTLTATVDLVEGDNTIVLTHDGAGVNWDYIQIETDAELSWTKTNNEGFISYDEDYEPEDDGDDGDDGDDDGNQGGDQSGSESKYDNMLTLEAENAALMNAVGSSTDSTYVLGMEENSSDNSIIQVKNFNMIGDEVVFQVNASAAIENVNLAAYVMPTTTAFDPSEHEGFIEVNDEAVDISTADGEAIASGSYGALNATISLQKGINYIEIICDTSGEVDFTLFVTNVGFMNVDRIDLNWDGSATITEITSGGSVTSLTTSESGTTTLEAENAALMNAVGSSTDSTYVLGMEENSSDNSIIQVKNFNMIGDEVVFQVNASAAIENVNLAAYVMPTTTAFDPSEHEGFIEVNDEAVDISTADGEVIASGSYGALNATISLQKGINYIEIICDTSGEVDFTLFVTNVGFMNVDRIDLSWTVS